MKKRHIILSDLHGNLKLFENALSASQYKKGKDVLVVAGDWTDIGDETEILWKRIKEEADVILIGNHECFSTDTELLTSEGWIYYKNINKNTKIATYNVEKDLIEWQKPTNIIIKKYHGEMYYIKHPHTDLIITPNHRILYAPHRAQAYEKLIWRKDPISKIDQRNSLVIKVSGRTDTKDYPILDDEIKIAGWLLTDGNINKYNQIHFYQRESKHHLIIEILNRLNWKYSIYKRKRNITEICNKKLKKEPEVECTITLKSPYNKKMLEIIDNKRKLPKWVYNLSERQFEIFLHSLIDGDGSRHIQNPETSLMFYSSFKDILDEIQICCFLNGYRTSISEYTSGNYRMNINKIRNKNIRDFQNALSKVPYNDDVWCVTVPNDTVVVRRNNSISITGNCAHIVGQEITPYDSKIDFTELPLEWAEMIRDEKIKLAYVANNEILITHAGVSEALINSTMHPYLYHLKDDRDVNKIAEILNYHLKNSITFEENGFFYENGMHSWLWNSPISPLWWRALNKGQQPARGIKQMVGHTPKGYYTSTQQRKLEEKDFILLDPYARKNFNRPDYFVYGLIEDENNTNKIKRISFDRSGIYRMVQQPKK